MKPVSMTAIVCLIVEAGFTAPVSLSGHPSRFPGDSAAAIKQSPVQKKASPAVAQKDSAVSPSKAAAVAPAPVQPVVNAPAAAVKIPAGILFGKFTKESGPYLIEGSVVVPSGQTLEFGPGCVIYMGGEYSTITVFGQLLAKGTSDAPVLFRSARERPNPWDWDRIYCRSRNRSVLEYCVIRHSNYGVMAENGSVSINHCTFETNSLHSLVARNSEVTITHSLFQGGQVVALLLQGGADVTAESLVVRNNITGVVCEDKSSLALTGGSIDKNNNGLVAFKGAAVSIVGADITKNRTGLIAQETILPRSRQMVFGNGLDFKIVSLGEIQKMLKPPEGVKSVALPKSEAPLVLKGGFKEGFSAVQTPREPQGNFIGNVTTGFTYFAPTSHPNPKDDTLRLQTRYLGEQSKGVLAGLQPELQLFTSGRRGDADINLLMDYYGNEWLNAPTHLRKNTFNLSVNYQDQTAVFGDFYENSSETSISNRKITGLKYAANFIEMGRGVKKVEVRAVAGETQIPKDSGSHEVDLYNTKVDSGMALRQQLTYLIGVTVKPNAISSVSVRSIIARDQMQSFLRPLVTDPAAPRPIAAQTGCIDGRVSLLGGKLGISAEGDMGTDDTLSSAHDSTTVTWYDPQIPSAVSKVFSAIPDQNHYALNLNVDGLWKGYLLNASGSDIAAGYFSAGNPYLETDRHYILLSASKQYTEQFSGSARYEYTRRSVSSVFNLNTNTSSPLDLNTIDVGFKYAPDPK
ncbi:MAG: right-handed parallel beta-helix repeat-containing protein, partial [Chitinivibrionales bacterium]|nr:right-handed parallel beta-helix repeat-containing protein [Chitinivibrionales bacterium]